MTIVLVVLHLLIAIALVGVILLQRSEGGGLGMGGGSSGGGFMTGRAAANALTRATAILAALFITTSLVLALLADSGRNRTRGSIMDAPPATQAPAVPAAPAPPVAN
jgi:preprotein translocase subunit SecG